MQSVLLNDISVFNKAQAFNEDGLYKKVSKRLLPFLFLCFVCNYLDRVNVSIAKLQMQSDLHFSETTFGFGMGIFFIGYFIFEVPSNIILYRVGAKKWIARIILSWGLVSGCMFFVKSDIAFYFLRFMLGVAEAGFFPGIILYLTYWYPSFRRCKATALFFTAIPISNLLGGPLSGWIIKSLNGVKGIYGWQWLFLIEAIPSIIVGIIAFFYLDDGINRANWLSIEEKVILSNNIEREENRKTQISFKAIFSNARLWKLIVVFFFLLSGQYILSFWTPTIIKGSGIKDTFSIGLLTSIPNLLAVVFMILMSRRSDRKKERKFHLACCSFIGCIGILTCAVFSQNIALCIIGLSVATMGVFSCFPIFWSLPTDILRGSAAAAGIGMVNAIGNTAGFFSNSFVGWMKDVTHSTTGSLYALALLLLLASILICSTVDIKSNVRL